MKSLLIIGGSGFFGKSILDFFFRHPYVFDEFSKIIIVSREAENFKNKFPQFVNDKTEFASIDITSTSDLPYADFIIHAAATTDSNHYLQYPELSKMNILNGVKNFVTILKKNYKKFKNSKLIYISSGAVYGKQPSSCRNITEDQSFNIEDLSPDKKIYAQAKITSELLLKEVSNEYDLNILIARCFSFVGPYLPLDLHFAIGNFIGSALVKNDIVVKSGSNVFRSYMYMDDLVLWLLKLLEFKNQFDIYNIGSDESIEIINLARLISKHYGCNLKIFPNHKEEPDIYVPSIQKVKNDFGLNLTFNLEDSISKTIDLIRSQN